MENNIVINESCKNLRAIGRSSLKNKWKTAVLGTLVYMVLAILPVLILDAIFAPDGSGNSGAASLYNLLVSGALTLGYTMFMISIFRKRDTSIAEVFYGFEKFGKALGLYLMMTIFVILWALLLIVPGIIAAYRYSLCFYILADNPNVGIMEAINQSKQMMRGNKWKMFCLSLSFIGWGILAILTAGIGLLWLTPYMTASTVAFYDIVNGNLKPNVIEAEATVVSEEPPQISESASEQEEETATAEKTGDADYKADEAITEKKPDDGNEK